MTEPPAELLTAGPGERGPRRAALRWVAVLAVAAVAAVGTGHALHDRRNRSALSRFAAVWAERGATHEALAAATTSIGAAAGPADAPLATRAVDALQEEDAARLGVLQRRAAGTAVSGPARRLRSDILAALATEQGALRAAAAAGAEVDAFRLVASAPAERVQAEFLALTGSSPTAAHPVTVHLHAADSALRRLSRLLDRPLPVRLLVNGPDGTSVLDLAASRVTPVAVIPDVLKAVDRGAYVVTLEGADVLAARLPDGPTALLAVDATALSAAPEPDRVWIGAAGPARATLVEVGTGRPLQQLRLPGPFRGAVSSGLLVGTAPPIVWDPVDRRTLRRLPACRRILGYGGDTVILTGCPGRGTTVHAVDAGTGRDTTVTLPGGTDVRAASPAPDGRHLAIAAQPRSSVERLLVADARTGRVSEVATPFAFAVADAVVWSSDSTRLFCTVGGLSDAPAASLYTYRLGDRDAVPIRYLRPGRVTPLAVLAPG